MSKAHPNQMDLFNMSEEMDKKQSAIPLEKQEELYPEGYDPNNVEESVPDLFVEPLEEELIRGQWTKEEWLSPVVEGGPTRQEVEEWKDKYGNVYFTPFEGEIFIWRTLSRPEYREVIRNTELNMLDREEIITDKCVLFPRNYSCQTYTSKGRAGVPSLLSEMIMDKSGFVAQSAPIKL